MVKSREMIGGRDVFFNDTATTEIYTLSLHDALPISTLRGRSRASCTSPRCGSSSSSRTSPEPPRNREPGLRPRAQARSEEQRLNSSHANTSYAVFCLKKKQPKPSLQCVSECYTDEAR